MSCTDSIVSFFFYQLLKHATVIKMHKHHSLDIIHSIHIDQTLTRYLILHIEFIV